MIPTEYSPVLTGDDVVCGVTTLVVIFAGLALGYMATEKFTTILR
jgi:hypothetical protein